MKEKDKLNYMILYVTPSGSFGHKRSGERDSLIECFKSEDASIHPQLVVSLGVSIFDGHKLISYDLISRVIQQHELIKTPEILEQKEKEILGEFARNYKVNPNITLIEI